MAFTLYGVSDSTAWIERGQGEFPRLDGIQEFKVITSAASAEFGKANSIIVVSRGGTNDLHGMLVYINRNRLLAAKKRFATQWDKPTYNRNESGGGQRAIEPSMNHELRAGYRHLRVYGKPWTTSR